MTRQAILPLAAALALAACNSEADVDAENASPEEVAEQLADAGEAENLIRPGKWRTTITLEELNVPGMPPEVARQMRAQMSGTETTESCLTPEDVKKPAEDFFAGGQKGCTYDRFTMVGGELDAVMTCSEGGAKMTMTIDGTYSADRYSARSTMALSQGGESGMTTAARVEAERVGDCDGA